MHSISESCIQRNFFLRCWFWSKEFLISSQLWTLILMWSFTFPGLTWDHFRCYKAISLYVFLIYFNYVSRSPLSTRNSCAHNRPRLICSDLFPFRIKIPRFDPRSFVVYLISAYVCQFISTLKSWWVIWADIVKQTTRIHPRSKNCGHFFTPVKFFHVRLNVCFTTVSEKFKWTSQFVNSLQKMTC